MDLGLGRFGDGRLQKGAFLHGRLAAHGGKGISVRQLGGGRAGEMRIWRFLHNPKVTVSEMAATVKERTCTQARGRHILAIQDTTALRVDEKGIGLFLHPVIAVDADDGTMLGLIDNTFLARRGGGRARRKARSIEEKESHRWILGAESASALTEAGAASVTVIEDREGDIYESFALKPAGVEMLVRAAQDRVLAGGTRLFAKADGWAEAGRMSVDLPATPGRKARQAQLSLRFGAVAIPCPVRRKRGEAELPKTVTVHFIDAREIDPPQGAEAAHWRLLTTHEVEDIEAARRIVGFYRKRWTIEQVFRTMKTKGFQIEALRQQEGPLQKLVMAILIAAITTMQLVAERGGAAGRPLGDALDPDDLPALEKVCESLEGKTQRQKNPHPKGSLAYAAWVFARLGGWTGYYGKPGPIVMLRGFTEFQTIKHGWDLRNV
ncbi:MAG: IS4 family transposase [Acetobacteraceae bacterium]